VILETPLLTREEKILTCDLSVTAGADFVETATGLFGGATVEDVSLMRFRCGYACPGQSIRWSAYG
jgi:deoxyribose-phosphate aldolase